MVAPSAMNSFVVELDTLIFSPKIQLLSNNGYTQSKVCLFMKHESSFKL